MKNTIFIVNAKLYDLIVWLIIFSDCPELQNKIQSKTFTNPYEIIVFYNDWVEKR